ncbi:hypothetical protein HAX54_036572, partial [Datura stramonium]|nr:hypothetical protein [Datura stramonium]
FTRVIDVPSISPSKALRIAMPIVSAWPFISGDLFGYPGEAGLLGKEGRGDIGVGWGSPLVGLLAFIRLGFAIARNDKARSVLYLRARVVLTPISKGAYVLHSLSTKRALERDPSLTAVVQSVPESERSRRNSHCLLR